MGSLAPVGLRSSGLCFYDMNRVIFLIETVKREYREGKQQEMNRACFLFARPSFIGGVARLFDFAGTLNTYNSSATGELADIRAFEEDWKAIGDDMRVVLAAYRKEQECKANG